MNKTEFINKFIEYRKKEIRLRYKLDKRRYIIKNNVNTNKFLKFLEKNKNEKFFSDALYELMNNDNSEIRVSAANFNLKYNLNTKYALNLLKKEINNKDDNHKWSSFYANIILKNYNK